MPPAWTADAVEALAWHHGVRLRADGRLTEWWQALLVARDLGRVAPLEVPAEADVHRLRRWPAAGGPPVELALDALQEWADSAGDRLELAWEVDRPAQAADGAVLRVAAPWPAQGGSFSLVLDAADGGWVEGLRLPPPQHDAAAGIWRWRLPELPARLGAADPHAADAADWLMSEPAVLVGRAVDGPAFAQAHGAASAVPPDLLTAVRLRDRPVATRIATLGARGYPPVALAAALRLAEVEAWPVRVRRRWQRPRDDLPRSAALLPTVAVWLPGEGQVLAAGAVASDLAAADAVVLDGSGRWVRLPAPPIHRARTGQIQQRSAEMVWVLGADPAAWSAAEPEGPGHRAPLRRWHSPAPHRPWARWGRVLGRGRTVWLGTPSDTEVTYTTDRVPAPMALAGPAGANWSRRVTALPEGGKVVSRLRLPGGAVPVEDQAALLRFVMQVEAAEGAPP
ncbi:MAG: hypothetical protein H6702_13740 [Myxococcales bacterium]|nr:hypothetical protein [Myxococcales bacterium]